MTGAAAVGVATAGCTAAFAGSAAGSGFGSATTGAGDEAGALETPGMITLNGPLAGGSSTSSPGFCAIAAGTIIMIAINAAVTANVQFVFANFMVFVPHRLK